MFKCPKQIRTEVSLFPAHRTQAFALQQIREKTLGDILRFFRPNTLPLYEGINGPPINAAEFLERFLCRGRFTLCLQHHAPMRCSKAHRSILPGPESFRGINRGSPLILSSAHSAI